MTFLQTLVSSNGKNLITGPRPSGYGWFEEWVDFSDTDATEQAIDRIQSKANSVYFALGAFNKGVDHLYSRKQVNCEELKAFWFDIDAGEAKFAKHGEGKVYRNQQDAFVALNEFVEWSGLPRPTYIVSSGEGLHVYWALDIPLKKDMWHKVALLLKAAHTAQGLLVDPARTADSASVLRPIGTYHTTGKVVTILETNAIISTENFIQRVVELKKQHSVLVQARTAQPVTPGFDLGPKPEFLEGRDSVMDREMTETPKSFGKIIRLHEIEGNGCKQLYEMYIDQQFVPEPMWSAGLSIIKFCDDRDEWSVKFSQNYPSYDPIETQRKMDQWLGPRTCSWFKENNPKGCEGCPHANKSSSWSPIVLAMNPEQGPVKITDVVVDKATQELIKEEFYIPTYPSPFSRGPTGGIYFRKMPTEADLEDPDFDPNVQVYPYDFYIYERIGRGIDGKPRFWVRHHTPHDGVLEFAVSSDIVTSGQQELRTLLGTYEVYLNQKEVALMGRYLHSQVTSLQSRKSILQAPMQLGWTPSDSFVLGRFEYSKAGVKPAPIPSTNLAQKYARACEPQISKEPLDVRLAGWNNVIRMLYGASDAGMYRLVLATGIGAPVRSHCSLERGGILNLYSEQSGFGKSTLTKAVLRMYADPDAFFFQANSGITQNALSDTLSYVNSIPVVLDEAGKFDPKTLMDVVHLSTSGLPKVRGSQSLNDVRQTAPGWKTFIYSSSNKSLWNMITEQQHENEAYLMRIAEININPLSQSLDKSYGDRAVRELEKYQGVVAQFLLPYLVKNIHVVEQMWVEASDALTKAANLHGRTRFWADMLTSAIVGARIGEEIGVYPFSADEVFQLAVECIEGMKARATNKAVDDTELLTEFLNNNLDMICVILREDTTNIMQRLPMRKVAVRVEVYSGKIFIDPMALQTFASSRQFGVERIESALESLGGRRGILVQMLKNTQYAAGNPPTRSWMVDTRDPRASRFFNMEDFAIMAENPTPNQEQESV